MSQQNRLNYKFKKKIINTVTILNKNRNFTHLTINTGSNQNVTLINSALTTKTATTRNNVSTMSWFNSTTRNQLEITLICLRRVRAFRVLFWLQLAMSPFWWGRSAARSFNKKDFRRHLALISGPIFASVLLVAR